MSWVCFSLKNWNKKKEKKKEKETAICIGRGLCFANAILCRMCDVNRTNELFLRYNKHEPFSILRRESQRISTKSTACTQIIIIVFSRWYGQWTLDSMVNNSSINKAYTEHCIAYTIRTFLGIHIFAIPILSY